MTADAPGSMPPMMSMPPTAAESQRMAAPATSTDGRPLIHECQLGTVYGPLPRDAGAARWVLVRHWHDSGGIEAVYGPYTRDRADFLRAMIGDSCNAWTVTELQQEPEAP